MIIINVLPLVSYDSDSYTIKVAYDHTRFASFLCWRYGKRREASTATGSRR